MTYSQPDWSDDGPLDCVTGFRSGESYLRWLDAQQTLPEWLAIRSELISGVHDNSPKLQELLGQVDSELADYLRVWPGPKISN